VAGRLGLVEFDEYVAQYGDGLLRHATIVAADPYLGQDIVQTVLERAYRRWPRIAQMDHPDAYLRRMVVNEFVSTRRRLRRVNPFACVPEPPAIRDHADQQSDRTTLVAELRKLPPRQRAAVALRYWDGLPDAEIAAQLGCSEGTVRGYIHRALQRLRAGLDEPGDQALPVNIVEIR